MPGMMVELTKGNCVVHGGVLGFEVELFKDKYKIRCKVTDGESGDIHESEYLVRPGDYQVWLDVLRGFVFSHLKTLRDIEKYSPVEVEEK